MVTETPDPPGLFADAFRRALAHRDVSLTQLHQRLRSVGVNVSLTTLSYWRSGARAPSPDRSSRTIEAIEEVLDLGGGGLTRHLRRRPHLERLSPPAPINGEEELRAVFQETIVALRAPDLSSYRELTTQCVGEVGIHGNLTSISTRSLLQAVDDGLQEIPLLFFAPEPTSVHPVVVAIGASISRSYAHDGGRVYGVVLAFDNPLQAGQSVFVETRADYPEKYPTNQELGASVSRPIRELALWLRFRADAPPRWIQVEEDIDGTTRVEARDLGTASSVHEIRRAFGPGSLSLRWGYDD